MRLFIAEKPAVANDIVKALGGNFTRHDGWFESDNAIVTNCFGHIIESQPPENYNPEYKAWKVETLPLRLYPVKYQPVESAAKIKMVGWASATPKRCWPNMASRRKSSIRS